MLPKKGDVVDWFSVVSSDVPYRGNVTAWHPKGDGNHELSTYKAGTSILIDVKSVDDKRDTVCITLLTIVGIKDVLVFKNSYGRSEGYDAIILRGI